MKNLEFEEEFNLILEPILNNSKFIETQNTIHHGILKLEHSLKVAYRTYKIAKKLNFDYISATRGAMLHDFFMANTNGKSFTKEAISLAFNHSEIALTNANKYFDLNIIEQDIVYKHMFPFVFVTVPKYKESYLVAFVDKVIGAGELYSKFRKHIVYKTLATVIPAFIITIGLIYGYN